jgi:hypothetical protein
MLTKRTPKEDANGDADDNDNDNHGRFSHSKAKLKVFTQIAICAGLIARRAAMGQGAGGRLSSKQPRESRDPYVSKAKRPQCAAPQLMEESKANAFAENLAKCPSMLLPYATIWGLVKGLPLHARNPESNRRFSNIHISDEVLNKYQPLPRGERVLCVACFCRSNESPWYRCHVQ